MTYAFHDLIVESDLPLPELPRSKRRPSLSIRVVDHIPDDDARWFHHWHVRNQSGRARRTPWLSFAHVRDGRGDLLRLPELADFGVSGDGLEIACAPAARVPRVTLRHLLLDQVLPLVLHLRGRLALHASAVEIPGFGAIAFAGPAGAGKSTLAAAMASRGGVVVTDDCLVFWGDDTPPAIVPGYPGVRLWPDSIRRLRLGGRATPVAHYTRKRRALTGRAGSRRAPVPLRVLFVLGPRTKRPGRTRVRSLTVRDRLMSLVPFTWVIDVADRASLARVFDQLCGVVARVPVARLTVGQSGGGLPRTADEVLALARALDLPAADP